MSATRGTVSRKRYNELLAEHTDLRKQLEAADKQVGERQRLVEEQFATITALEATVERGGRQMALMQSQLNAAHKDHELAAALVPLVRHLLERLDLAGGTV